VTDVMNEGRERGRERGVHRVFLGYAPGVGKTHAMLMEARRRKALGEDVVVGYIEPHTRPDTMALVHDLESVSPRGIPYRGTAFTELDAEAIIARNPRLVLVDELAHANVPGARHEKRWETVTEILDEGIDVFSTLNVQHIDSLSDYVYQVSGIRVAETVPEAVLDAAELVVIDADPDELLDRVKRGSVLAPDEVGQALTHFFRKPTLVALRDRALAFRREDTGSVVTGGSR
jgi:two-component system sensor histidine kinase KdpD